MKEKLLSFWIFSEPYLIKFGKFILENKMYSSISILIGIIIGVIFF